MPDDNPQNPQPWEFVRQIDPQLAAHMAQQWNLHVLEGVQRKQLPYPLPSPRPAGTPIASARFTHADRNARLVTVLLTPAVHQFLLVGHKESRLLPQALSETFGLLRAEYHLPISHLALALVSRAALIADPAVETDESVLALPEEGDGEDAPHGGAALEIVVHHTAESAYASQPHRMLMVSSVWHQLDPRTAEPVLDARTASLHHAHHYLAKHPAGQTIPESLRG